MKARLEEARVQMCETTDRNRIVKAEGVEASWHMTAKPTGSVLRVNAVFVPRAVRVLTWGWPRTKIKNLLALGVSLKSAIQHGCSSNSYWQMSRTPVINQAIFNAWLKEQGLLSVKTKFRRRLTCTQVMPELKTCGARHRVTRQKRRGRLRRACQLVEPLNEGPARWVVWGLGVRSSWLPD
ncbi:hypothetical protein MIZ03_2093 [Rhodoferax lithotrophicus]|uniref:Uncharacterized protein n=1 Tax=Rhodoferax lithotrophicus TaxID=2798804 RepID=A0ABM7MLY2_9BURK|nr:hypothetical protein MIZ03_2093 [Rhodoferax sp. MIZ03]